MTNHNTEKHDAKIAKAVFALYDISVKLQVMKFTAKLTPEEVKGVIGDTSACPELPLSFHVGALRQFYDGHFDNETVKVKVDLDPTAETNIMMAVDGEEHHFKC